MNNLFSTHPIVTKTKKTPCILESLSKTFRQCWDIVHNADNHNSPDDLEQRLLIISYVAYAIASITHLSPKNFKFASQFLPSGDFQCILVTLNNYLTAHSVVDNAEDVKIQRTLSQIRLIVDALLSQME